MSWCDANGQDVPSCFAGDGQPALIYLLRLPVWSQIAAGTGAMVRFVVELADMPVSLSLHEQQPDGLVVDYPVYLEYSNFLINIGSYYN